MKIAWFNKVSTEKRPVNSIEDRVLALESGQRAMTLEWENTYEKILKALRKLNKRARDEAERDERREAETHEDAPGATNGALLGMDPISAKIHARRMRVPPGNASQG